MRAPPRGSTSRAHRPRHRRGLGRGRPAAARDGIDAGPRHGDQHAHDGHGVHLLAYLPDPTYPPLVAELDADPRGPQRPAAGDARAAARARRRDRRRRRTPVAGERPRPGARTSPTPWSSSGVVADRNEAFGRFLEPRAARRTPTATRRPREMIAHRRRGRRGQRDRPPVGARTAAGAGRGDARRAARRRAGRDRGRPPGPRRRPPATRLRGIARDLDLSSPAPATTTAPARSTTSSAATPPRPRSSTGCSSWPPAAARPAERTAVVRP